MTTQRVRVQIDTQKIKDNYNRLCSLVQENCKVMAVVKADGYGHGAVEVCRLLEGCGCTYFAVACIEEALHLRENGVTGNILILGNTDPSYAKQLEEQNLIQTVDTAEYANALASCGNVRVHIKVDTGMSRLGFYCHSDEDVEDAASAIQTVASMEHLQVEGIFTHFADSDGEADSFTRKQFGVFSSLLERLEEKKAAVGLRHCCNSAGILRFQSVTVGSHGFAVIHQGEYLQRLGGVKGDLAPCFRHRHGKTNVLPFCGHRLGGGKLFFGCGTRPSTARQQQ